MNKLFSIVVPCYNVEKKVQKALDSVRMQTFRNFEVIAINDGSTDNTLNVLDAYSNQRFFDMNIIDQTNKGIGGARNTGIKAAESDFVAFLDADDYWKPEKLNEVNKILLAKDYDLLCHDEYVVSDGTETKVNRYGPHTTYEDLLFKGNCISTSATVVRRKCILDAGWFSEDLEINGVEDYDLWLRLSLLGINVHYLHIPLGYYVLHENNISGNILKYREKAIKNLENHLSGWVKENPRDKKRALKRTAKEDRGFAVYLNRSGHFSDSMRFTLMSLKKNCLSAKTWIVFIANLLHIRFSTI